MIIGISNLGSTSFKSKIIDINEKNEIKTLGTAGIDKLKSDDLSNFTHSVGENPSTKEVVNIMGFEAAIKLTLDKFVKNKVISKPQNIEALGFKCILGEKNGANKLTPETLAELKRYTFVAPIHNLPYLEAISIFSSILNVPMVGVFEPSFHYTIPEFRRLSGYPWEWYEKLGIKKNGFHGASHRYLSAVAFKLMGTEKVKLLTIHLGGSSSITAVKDGKSIDTSMSFSPNSGLIQGTRVGDIDGTALLYAMKELDLTIDEAQDLLSNKSGLKEIAGIGTEDFREILNAADSGNGRAKLAVNLYIDGIKKYIGSYGAIMGGINCIIFSGGIGEKSTFIREKCLENMEYMGVKLDPVKNKELNGTQGLISADYSIFDSRAKVFIVPTNEEIIVAYFTKRVVEEGRDLTPEEMIFRF